MTAEPDGFVGPRRDFRAAIALIERASATIDSLQARCRQLEAEASGIRKRAKLEVKAAEALADDWQKLARATKGQLEASERRLGLTKQYAEAAEERAELAKQRLEAMQQIAAAEAEQFARIHDRIVAAFGVGSRAHLALEDALGGRTSKP